MMIISLVSPMGKEVMLTKLEWSMVPLVFVVGILITRFSYVMIVVREDRVTWGLGAKMTLMVWDNSDVVEQVRLSVSHEPVASLGKEMELSGVRQPLIERTS
jgi:hypothetical protein